jgi:uridine kinase
LLRGIAIIEVVAFPTSRWRSDNAFNVMLDFDDVISRVVDRSPLRLVAIDGLPLAGKSTLADRLASALGGSCVRLDDFVKPEAEWRSHDQPSFPFDFIRYDAFMAAVQGLAMKGVCSFRPFDWATFGVADEVREIRADRPVVVEGVSALHPDLAPLYNLRIWVASDAASTLAASHERGVGRWAREWRELFLPSVELYLRTSPWECADIVARGRGKNGP